jgi:tetratricopeptide (TPR) repeat protein
MESGLNQPDQANQLIDAACNWMRKRIDESKKLGKLTELSENFIRFKIGELRNLQGSLTVRHGRFQESRPRFEEAVQELEPLVQSGKLDSQNQHMARLILMEALSGMSMHEANFGKLSEARKIQQRALSWIESDQATTVPEAVALLQAHGNAAILHQRAGEIPEALNRLEMAAHATENVQLPPTVELVSLQSQFAQYRARLMMATSDKESAVNVLSELVKKEAASVEQHPNLSGLVEVYQSTAIELQTILTSTGKHDQAIQLLADWTELAQKLTRLTAPPQSHWILLINAHHSAGHLYQEIKRNELALEKYATAIEVCQEALRRNYRTQQVLYQLVELNLHQFQILAPTTPLDQLEPYFEKAVSAAEELMRLPTIPQVNNLAAIDKLQQNLNLMRDSGHKDAAYRWGATLQFKKLSR